MTFDELLAEGASIDVSTWGAGFLPGRFIEEPPPWQYAEIVRRYAADATTMLDMGTGDGSALLGLAPLPAHTVAYEEWAPTVPAATATLRPAGIPLVRCLGALDNTELSEPGHPTLPFRDATFDVVVNRHESFDPADVHRVLRPGGVFVTQQVGGDHGDRVRRLLGLPPLTGPHWTLATAKDQVADAGLTVLDAAEASPDVRFSDVGAFVAYLRAVPWYVPGFEVNSYRDRLRELHESGDMRTPFRLFWLSAKRAN